MPDDLDVSDILPEDPMARAAAMASALRGQQQMAQELSYYGSGKPFETAPAMMNEQAKEERQNQVQQANALREYAALKNNIAHQQNEISLREQEHRDLLAHQKEEMDLQRFRLEHPEANKPAPENIVQKVNNQLAAVAPGGDIDALEKAQAAVGLSAITGAAGPGLGAEGAYKDAIKAHGAAVAAARLPLGRETPESVNEEVARMPSGAISKERAGAYWNETRKAMIDNAEAQIRSLEAAGFSPRQVADMRVRLEAAKALRAGPAGQPSKDPKERVKQLRGQGLKPEEIKAQLRKEGF